MIHAIKGVKMYKKDTVIYVLITSLFYLQSHIYKQINITNDIVTKRICYVSYDMYITYEHIEYA